MLPDYIFTAEEAKLPKNAEAEYNVAAHIAADYMKPDSPSWRTITVLYSFFHGITGEYMHFVRIDRRLKDRTISELKSITDEELHNLKKVHCG